MDVRTLQLFGKALAHLAFEDAVKEGGYFGKPRDLVAIEESDLYGALSMRFDEDRMDCVHAAMYYEYGKLAHLPEPILADYRRRLYRQLAAMTEAALAIGKRDVP